MPQTLLDYLASQFPAAKRTTLRRMLEAERVTVGGKVAKNARQPIDPRDTVVIRDAPPRRPRVAPSLPFEVVEEDAHLLVVNKPPGLLTSTVPREPRPTLLAAVWEYVRSREPRAQVGLIHRLDRDASGLLIFSKNDAAYASLKGQFFRHTVKREYLALVHGRPRERAGRIETRLVERTDGVVHSTRMSGKGEIAVTDYELLKSEGNRSLLRVTLQTGRKHQIRVHLSERGMPIVGDTVYGPQTTEPRLLLAAVRLVIEHPRDGREREFEIPVPDFFPKSFRSPGGQAPGSEAPGA